MDAVYCGLLDDFAIRIRDGPTIETLSQLNRLLVTAVLVGDPIIINDGHFLMNPAIQEAVISPEKSPLLKLVKKGFVRILSRTGGKLTALPKFMADQGIATAEDMLKSEFYLHSLSSALADWDALVDDGQSGAHHYLSWPNKQTNVLYETMIEAGMTALAASSAKVRPETIDRVTEELGDRIGSRTAWEQTTNRLVAQDVLRWREQRILLAAANEAHQYTFGSLLLDECDQVSVQMRASRFLGEFEKVDPVTDPNPDRTTIFAPREAIASKGVGDQWSRLVGLLDDDNAHDEKALFRQRRDTYYAGGSITTAELQEIAKKYSLTVARQFGHDRVVDTGVALTFAMGGVALGALVCGPPGLVVGLVMAGTGVLAGRVKPMQSLVRRIGQSNPADWVGAITAAEYRRAASMFRVDPTKVRPIVDRLPEFVHP